MSAPVEGAYDDRLVRVALARVAEPGKVRLLDLVRATSAGEVHDRLLHDPQMGERIRAVEPARELDEAVRLGLRFVIPGDAEWPSQLDALAVAAPVQDRGGVPLGLWVRGPVRLDQLTSSVAVVGSRSATTYGADVAREIASSLAAAGRTVVSGAAFGIDQAAHRGAIAARGRTVAVLACGADRAYPPRHRELIEHIAAEGAVVSETFPGGAPMRVRFLSRNRIIAALAVGTVVVEAALRSGALNTANWATRTNRALMGVPGPVTSASSAGVHQLIRNGAASLVGSGAEVLEVVGAAGEHLLETPRGRDRPRDALTRRQREVLDAVPVGRPAPAASIAHVGGLGPAEVEEELLAMERRGFVAREEGGWRLAALAHD